MNNGTKNLGGKRIGIFGKGGSGKSTVTVFLAKALADRGYQVAVLDADSTNFGLAQAFGFRESPRPLLDYFGGMVFQGGQVTCPVEDPFPLPNSEIALNTFSKEYFVQNSAGISYFSCGKICDKGPGAGCDGPMAKIARDATFSSQGQPLATLVDFKAGFEDSARGAITSMDTVIVVADPSRTSVEVAFYMKAMVEQIQAGVLPSTKHMGNPEDIAMAQKVFLQSKIRHTAIIMNKIIGAEMEAYLRSKLKEMELDLAGIVYSDPQIMEQWMKGEELMAGAHKKELAEIVSNLEMLDSKHERAAVAMTK